MSWCGTRKAEKLLNNPSDIVVFDIETTGLDLKTAEILQIAICDGNGCMLFSSYVRPTKHKSWKSAEKINGISPEMVANAPTFAKIKSQVQEIFNNAKVVAGYNCKRFDIPIIERYHVVLPQSCFDVMSEFGIYNPIGRHRLIDCARYCGVSYSPHDATEDAVATAQCMQYLLRSPGFVKAKTESHKSRQKESAASVEPAKEAKQAKRPVFSRLFGLLFKKHKFHPLLFGLLLMSVGIGALYYQMGGSFQRINMDLLSPALMYDAAKTSVGSILLGCLIPVGAIFTIDGIITSIKKAILWFINIVRKLLS